MQHKLLLFVAVVAVAALLVPVGSANTPNGKGLFGPYYRDCTGAFEYHGDVMMPAGATLFAGGHHLVILDMTLTYMGTDVLYYQGHYGVRAGQLSGGIETCEGDFPEYGLHVISHSVEVP